MIDSNEMGHCERAVLMVASGKEEMMEGEKAVVGQCLAHAAAVTRYSAAFTVLSRRLESRTLQVTRRGLARLVIWKIKRRRQIERVLATKTIDLAMSCSKLSCGRGSDGEPGA